MMPMDQPAFVAKAPLRTYSRHGRVTKRSSATLPGYLSQSLTEADDKGAGHLGAQPGFQDRQRRRKTAPLGQTLTEVFWEHLSSSAPVLTRSLEIDHLKPRTSFEVEEDAATIDTQPHSFEADISMPAKHGNQSLNTSLGQRAHDSTLELAAAKSIKQYGMSLKKLDNDDDLSKPEIFKDRAIAPSLKPRSEQRKLLCLSLKCSPKTKRARRVLDVDESLSVVEATSGDARPGFKATTASRNYGSSQEFRKLPVAKESRATHSSYGFERHEARTVALAKRRRIDNIDHSIGPLELTQKIVANQKLEGPTWTRGQKKTRVARHTSPWSKRQGFHTSSFSFNLEEDIEPFQVDPSYFADEAPRNRSKRRTSHIFRDEEEPLALSISAALTDGHTTHIEADVEVVRTSLAKNDKVASYLSDGDESIVLLVHPEDDEDETTLAIISRTDTPEHGMDIQEVDGQLPPKQWVLNVLDYGEDTIALRPDSREWMREIEIPDTSPRT